MKVNYRLSFWGEDGRKFPGPVIAAPEDAVSVANVEVWLVPEEDFYAKPFKPGAFQVIDPEEETDERSPEAGTSAG